MNEPRTCRTCGTSIPAGTPPGQCPKCLINLGMIRETVSPDDDVAKESARLRPFGGYQLLRQISCGAMGVVYEARQNGLNRNVALKMILDTRVSSPEARRRFLIEAEAAARLDHPNIVPVYEVGEVDDLPFISMKLIQGETLRTKIERGDFRLPGTNNGANKAPSLAIQRTIAALVAALARAVHHAHTHNVIHRDLKPANIILDGDGKPHLTDFSLARIVDDQRVSVTDPGSIMGTVPYMSHEQVRAEKVTAASDIYSLGVILYELLTGRLPFQGNTPHETMTLIETQPPLRPRALHKYIAKDLEKVCIKCMEKDPGNRYPSAGALADDLENWLENRPVKARPAGVVLRVFRWTRRNPVGVALIASLSLALAMGLVLVVKLAGIQARARAQVIQNWTWAAEELWRDPNRSSMLIRAEEIASLRDRAVADNAWRFVFAVNIQDNPVAQVEAWAPFLEHLQKQMSRSLHWPVVFDLKFRKLSQNSFQEIATDGADLQRFGAASYLRAQELNPGIHAVVQEDVGKEAVILVHNDSPITNLSQFAGHSFAFGDTNSTIHYWAKVYLARAGVCGTNLSFYRYFDEAADGQGGTTPFASSKKGAEQVRARKVDGATAQRQYIDHSAHNKSLREIFRFKVNPDVYAAKSGLDPAVIQAFQDAMRSIKDTNLIATLPIQRGVQRFLPPDDAEIDKLRAAMTNEVARFEGRAPAPATSSKETSRPTP